MTSIVILHENDSEISMDKRSNCDIYTCDKNEQMHVVIDNIHHAVDVDFHSKELIEIKLIKKYTLVRNIFWLH